MSLESIALIPSGVKATKVYSQLPVNGNGDFTFDRGTSNAQTRVNKDGLIENVDQDVPRLDYLDGGCPSLLLEPSSTNLITYSEEFDNVYWTIQSSSISANVSLSPDGSVNADKFIPDNGVGGNRSIGKNITSLTGLHTFSVFVKDNDFNYVHLRIRNTPNRQVVFDLSNETFTNYGAESGSIIKIGDYYRISATFDPSSSDVAGQLFVSISLSDSGGNILSFDGDGVKGITIWGAQLEQQSYATSYIPTSGSTETRNAETCNGAGTTAEINSQEGVLFFEGRALADDLSFRAIALSDTSVANRVIFYYTNTSNKIICDLKVGGGVEFGANHTLIDITKYTKIAVSYKENEFKLYVNGLLVGLDPSGSVPSSGVFTELAFDDGAGGSDFYGRVKKLSVYDSALNDSELEALTGFGSFSEMASYLSYS